MKELIFEKSKERCTLLDKNLYIFQCNLNTHCSPIQDKISTFMKIFPNSAIKVPFFQLNNKFYGTNYFSVFPIEIQDFLNTFKLETYKMTNTSFSFLYIKQNKLLSHNQLNQQSKIICTLNSNQKHLQNEIQENILKVTKQLNYFLNFYNSNERYKRSDFLSELLSKTFFSDTQDLETVHSVFNNYLSSHNRQIYVEKRLFKNIKINENKIIDEIHLLEVSLYFSKFKILSLEKLENLNTNSLIFIYSLNNLYKELQYLRNIINNVLLRNPSEKSCLRGLGCFFNSQILYDQHQIQIELHIIELHPTVKVMNTCKLYNVSHTYAAHNSLNINPNCTQIRPLNNLEYFIENILLIIYNSTFSFSCNTKMIFYVNNSPFKCNKNPKVFLPNLYSFQLNLNSTNYIKKELHSRHFLFSTNDSFGQIIFENHLNIVNNLDSPNLTIFDQYLPSVKIEPTILGWALISCIIFFIIASTFIICYFFNSTFYNLLALIQCCKLKKSDTNLDMHQQVPQNDSLESLHDFQNLQSFVQN